MNITELAEHLLIVSNQYFVGDDIEVDETILSGLATRALRVYKSFRPLVTQTPYGISGYRTLIDIFDNRKVVGISNIYFAEPMLSEEDGKVDFDWWYVKDTNILHSAITGSYWMEIWTEPLLSDMGIDDGIFIDLVLGLYLMYIGSSRKSFKFGDLPFDNDGDDLYSEGKELFETTKEKLSEVNDSWYLSIL